MKSITSQIMQQFVKKAVKRLTGDWVIMGGSILPLLGKQVRVTLDIDLAGPQTATQRQTLLLMEIAEELGLPPEAINTAGAFFLHRIPQWKSHLILIAGDKKGKIFRPDCWLYIKLKLARLSESDLSDCLAILHENEELISKDREELLKEVKAELKKEFADSTKNQRLQDLMLALQRI